MNLCIHSSDPAKRDPRGCSQCLGARPSVHRRIGQAPASETVDTDELSANTGYDGRAKSVRPRRENKPTKPSRADVSAKRSAAARSRWSRGIPAGYYSTADLARLTGLSSNVARNTAKAAGILVQKQSNYYLFAKDAVDAWIARRADERREKIARRADERRDSDVEAAPYVANEASPSAPEVAVEAVEIGTAPVRPTQVERWIAYRAAAGYYIDQDLADLTGLTPRAAHAAARLARVTMIKRGGRWVFVRTSADAWIARSDFQRPGGDAVAGHELHPGALSDDEETL